MPAATHHSFAHEIRFLLRDHLKHFASLAALAAAGAAGYVATVMRSGTQDAPSLAIPLLSLAPILIVAAAATLGHIMFAPISPLSIGALSRTLPVPFWSLFAPRLWLLLAGCVALPCLATAAAIGATFPDAIIERTAVAALILWVAVWTGIQSGLTLNSGVPTARAWRVTRCALIISAPMLALIVLNQATEAAWLLTNEGMNAAINICLTLGILAVYLPARTALLLNRSHRGIPILWETPLLLAIVPFYWWFPGEGLPSIERPETLPACVMTAESAAVTTTPDGKVVMIPITGLREPVFPNYNARPIDIRWQLEATGNGVCKKAGVFIPNPTHFGWNQPGASSLLQLTLPAVATEGSMPAWGNARGKTLRIKGVMQGEKYLPNLFAYFSLQAGGTWRTPRRVCHVGPVEFDDGTMRVSLRQVRLPSLFERSPSVKSPLYAYLINRKRREIAGIGGGDCATLTGIGIEEWCGRYDHTAPVGFDTNKPGDLEIRLMSEDYRKVTIPFEITLRLPTE